jgi:hypothetical protein
MTLYIDFNKIDNIDFKYSMNISRNTIKVTLVICNVIS